MKKERFRVCAVCGRRHDTTYGFHTTLRRLGLKGDEAVPECVMKARKYIEGLVRLEKEGSDS